MHLAFTRQDAAVNPHGRQEEVRLCMLMLWEGGVPLRSSSTTSSASTDPRTHADYLRLLPVKPSSQNSWREVFYRRRSWRTKRVRRGGIGRIGFHRSPQRNVSFYAVIYISTLAGSYPPINLVDTSRPSLIPAFASGHAHPIN